MISHCIMILQCRYASDASDLISPIKCVKVLRKWQHALAVSKESVMPSHRCHTISLSRTLLLWSEPTARYYTVLAYSYSIHYCTQ